MPETKPTSSKRLLRVNEIVAPDGPLPLRKSAWWAGVADGRFPKPLKLGSRITVWKAEEIEELLQNGVADLRSAKK